MARLVTLLAVSLYLFGGPSARAEDPFSDEAFVQKAAQCSMTEVNIGKIAAAKAMTNGVKAYAERLVKDHTKANEDLMKAASAAGLTVPNKLDEKHLKDVDHFKDYNGTNFDADFLNHMIPDHEKAVALFTQASKEAKNQALKDFAAKTLPVLEEHLAMAKKLAGK